MPCLVFTICVAGVKHNEYVVHGPTFSFIVILTLITHTVAGTNSNEMLESQASVQTIHQPTQ